MRERDAFGGFLFLENLNRDDEAEDGSENEESEGEGKHGEECFGHSMLRVGEGYSFVHVAGLSGATFTAIFGGGPVLRTGRT